MQPQSNEYRKRLLEADPTPGDVAAVATDYEAMIRSVMALICDRFERTPDYPWVDTKLSVLSGDDFPVGDPIRGRGAVYGWIQGRALESMAGHARWFGACELTERIEPLVRSVASSLGRVRSRNGGHAFFTMSSGGDPFAIGPDGAWVPVTLDTDSPATFSDVFCAKGLYAAAAFLGDRDALAEAHDYCTTVVDALFEGRFESDQQPMDPANPVDAPPGRHSHGPFMIAIGLAALMVELERSPDSVAMGVGLIEHVMGAYVNTDGRWPDLQPNDYVEFIGDDGRPYESQAGVLSDPGHALEFVGLAMKLASAARASGATSDSQLDSIGAVERAAPGLLRHVFGYGFQEPYGICKLVDLRTRRVVNSDMPWWSLPETMRAALGCYRVATNDSERDACLGVFAACHNAFAARYVRADRHLMAVQTIDAKGRAVDVIPATPDADPGFHSGLSLIDCLRTIVDLTRR